MLKMIHSIWAYVALAVLIIAVVNAFIAIFKKREYTARDLRISLFALIVSHIQFLIGLAAYYMSSFYTTMRSIGMGEVMKNAELRKPLVEHPIMILIAIILITVGFAKHKKKMTSGGKFRSIAMYYTIALVLILAVIPWKLWLSS